MGKQNLPRLPGKSTIHSNSVVDLVESIKTAQVNTKNQLNEWLKSNIDFNSKAVIDLWIKQRDKHKQALLDLVIEHTSAADAVNEVNEILKYGLLMDEVAIDTAETNTIIGKLFRIRVTDLLISKTKLGALYKQDVVRRSIAREFPMKDGISNKSEKAVHINVPRVPIRSNMRPSKTEQAVSNKPLPDDEF